MLCERHNRILLCLLYRKVIELVLAGGPDAVLRGHRWLRRHQFFDIKSDMYVLSYQNAEIEGESYIFEWPISEENIKAFWGKR